MAKRSAPDICHEAQFLMPQSTHAFPMLPAAPAPRPAGYAPRRAEAHPYAAVLQPPVRLALRALPTALAYASLSFWEERVPGEVKRTTIEKDISLTATVQPGYLRVDYTATPALRKPDLSSFERVLLLLAELYSHLELHVAPTGQLAAVGNQGEVQQTWARVKQELALRSGGDDDFTQVLAAGLDEQLGRPGAVLASLRFDYFFGFLLQNIYGQQFESSARYGQARCFPRFFAGTDLWFWERLELAEPTAPARVAVRLTGILDEAQTDLVAVAQELVAAQQLAVPAGPALPLPAPKALRFAYEATAELDAATGWPLLVEASVRCGVADASYSKEYFIRIEQRNPTL
jgi:hypothetical protein